MLKKTIILALAAIAAGLNNIDAILPSEALFNNEATDTTRLSSLLVEAARIGNSSDRMAWLADCFVGTPYKAGTLEVAPDRLVINLDSLDCTTFAETVVTLAYTAGEGRTSWRDYVYNLERIRYRGGSLNGYASRLHYFSDWVVDNVHRGNLREATTRMPVTDWAVKTLSYMTDHRELYPALSDSLEYERIKNSEIGYHNHRFPYIKANRLGSKEMIAALRDGDLIALTTKTPGLDVTHLGFVKKIDGAVYLVHASSRQGEVVVDESKLQDYMRRTGATGIRVIRLAE